jgi:hypothetical protein
MNFIQLTGFWGFLSITIAVVLICITALIIIYMITKKFNNLKLLNNKIELETDKSDNFSNIVFNIIRFNSKIRDEKDSIFPEQMNYLEMKLNYIREYDLKCYLNLLLIKATDIPADKLIKSDYYQNYSNMVYRVYHEVLLVFRGFLKENHIENKTDKTWSDYKTERIDFMISKMNRELNFIFQPAFSLVSIKELDEMMKKDVTVYIKESFNDIFEVSKTISNEKNSNIEEIKQEMNEFYKKFCGEEINF